MARVAIIGASIGGLPAAYEARALLDKKHKVTVLWYVDFFHFVPSNPWVAVGWRTRKDISFALGPVLEKKGIEFINAAADRIEPEQNRVITSKGEVPYDYLVIASAPAASRNRFVRWTMPSKHGEPIKVFSKIPVPSWLVPPKARPVSARPMRWRLSSMPIYAGRNSGRRSPCIL